MVDWAPWREPIEVGAGPPHFADLVGRWNAAREDVGRAPALPVEGIVEKTEALLEDERADKQRDLAVYVAAAVAFGIALLVWGPGLFSSHGTAASRASPCAAALAFGKEIGFGVLVLVGIGRALARRPSKLRQELRDAAARTRGAPSGARGDGPRAR
jgi:hypothetical protein